jgi:transcriptional regulator with XRE-family HTH domain
VTTKDQLLSAFGETVRAQRQAIDISQEELAGRARLHRTYVAGVERGLRNASLKALSQIATGLDMPLSQLFAHMEKNTRRGRVNG